MTIEKTIDGSKAILKISGWLDTQTAPNLGKELAELDSSIEALTLDMAELEYTSSAGLRQIVAAHKKMKGNLIIKNVAAQIMDVFKMTGFDKVLNIE